MSRRNFPTAARASRPLDAQALNALALSYLARYATTRAKLRGYLIRKVTERGWDGDDSAPVEAIVERCATLGYVDDASFAASRGAALTRRGYGEQRVAAALRSVGIDDDVAAPVREAIRENALSAALAFARRKRIGPYAGGEIDVEKRRRNLAALLRAGHSMDIARRIAFAEAGAELDDR